MRGGVRWGERMSKTGLNFDDREFDGRDALYEFYQENPEEASKDGHEV
jgi:hypothetical protein